MRRNTIQVRDAMLGDIDTLIGFAAHVRDLPNGRRSGARSSAGTDVRDRYESLLINPTRRVVLAVEDTGAEGVEAVLGMAVLAVDVAGELLDIPVIRVSHLVVERAQRRRGAGRALVTAAAAYAGEMGLDHISVGAATTDREANRFLARLGFAPVMVRRVASLGMLRRQMAIPDSAEASATVVRRRGRSVRRVLTRSQLGRAPDSV